MQQYLMRTDSDCGPAALAAVLNESYENLLDRWPGGWKDGDRGILGAPNDTPYDHFSLLAGMGIPWQVRTCREILAGEATNDKTLILLHALDHPYLSQHWVVLKEVTPVLVTVWWGKPECQVKQFTAENFRQLYAGGWPACAYEIGIGDTKLSWWQRLVAWLTGTFC